MQIKRKKGQKIVEVTESGIKKLNELGWVIIQVINCKEKFNPITERYEVVYVVLIEKSFTKEDFDTYAE